MACCGHCGTPLKDGALSCSLCGGTAIPCHAERGLQPLYGLGETLSGRFRVERILGSGASGVVYGVHDSHTERRVALKILWERASEGDPTLERLKRELRAAQHAPNPHCVTVYDLLFVQEHPAILMEWVDGETLRGRILERGALPLEEAAALIGQVLEAAAHLHAVGVIHRDIKSGNVMLATDGTAKLGDFGLAKGETVGATLTETGVALGTPGYMAPEVIRGGPATPASDLYSIGIMLFETLTGRMPFQGSSALEVASRQLSESPPLGLLKQYRVPRWLSRVTARLLERDPADRFPSAREALKAIESHSAGFALARRWRWRIAAASLLLAFAFAAVLWGRHAVRVAPLHLSFHDRLLEVRSPSGSLLWTRTLPQAIQTAVEGHFGPGGTRAIACAIQWNPSSTSPYETNQIVAFTAAGAPLKSFGETIERSSFSHRYFIKLSTHRFSPQGREKLVAYIQHATWYPSALTVYGDDALAPSDNLAGPRYLTFANSGSMQRLAFKDLDGDGTDEVICIGINNRLYRMLFASVLRIQAPSGQLDRGPLSPDVAWAPSDNALYYRLFAAKELPVDLGPAGRSDPPGLMVLTRSAQWELSSKGMLHDDVSILPEESVVEKINALLPNLCSLRDQGNFRELEGALREWPENLVQPYAWLGILFRVQALVGLGRYGECDQLLAPAIADRTNDPTPLYAYQFWADAAFLSGRYAECLSRLASIPASDRLMRVELGHTAVWASIYEGDTDVASHIFMNPAYDFFAWYPKMFLGVNTLLEGRLAEAETQFKTLQGDLPNGGDVEQWLARALLAQGKAQEAATLLQHMATAFPGEGIERSLLSVEARWLGGDHQLALVSEADGLLAALRQEAVYSVEVRAVLPLEIASAARLHRASGDFPGASRLKAEALRLAPKSWRTGLAF